MSNCSSNHRDSIYQRLRYLELMLCNRDASCESKPNPAVNITSLDDVMDSATRLAVSPSEKNLWNTAANTINTNAEDIITLHSLIAAHIAARNNPNFVTKAQVGLGNADNTSDLDKPISNLTQVALDGKLGSDELDAHINDNNNPHNVTAAQVGLGEVNNTSDINKPISSATQFALSLLQSNKQNTLISGSNIKTINNQSLLGGGNIEIQSSGGEADTVQWNNITGKPSTFVPSSHTHIATQILQDSTHRFLTDTERAKLTSIAPSATQNSTDAALRDRATHTGTQTSASISDFTEAVQDAVAAFLGAGSNVTVTYNDASNTLTVSSTGGTSGGLDAETVRDVIGASIVGVGNISVNYNDTNDTITISTTATQNSTDAALRDRSTHTGMQPATSIIQTPTHRFVSDTEKTVWNNGGQVESTITNGSAFAVSSNAVYDALQTKADLVNSVIPTVQLPAFHFSTASFTGTGTEANPLDAKPFYLDTAHFQGTGAIGNKIQINQAIMDRIAALEATVISLQSQIDNIVSGGGTPPANTTPAAPTIIANDTADTIDATHALGDSEILVSINNGAYVQFDGTPIAVGDVARAAGYYKFKIKAATGRNESPIASSPAFTVAGTPPPSGNPEPMIASRKDMGIVTGATTTLNNVVSPVDGLSTGDTVMETATTGQHRLEWFENAAPAMPAGTYIYSFYCKPIDGLTKFLFYIANGSKGGMFADVDLGALSMTTPVSDVRNSTPDPADFQWENMGGGVLSEANGWFRVYMYGTKMDAGENITPIVAFYDNNGVENHLGVTSKGLQVANFGVQTGTVIGPWVDTSI